jgi:DNA-binding transcriptional MerR regulator
VTTASYFTIGAVARHFGIPTWQVRRAIERGLITEPPRLGAYRVFTAGDLLNIEHGLRAAGYLPRGQGAASV